MTSIKKGIKLKLNYKHTCDLKRCSVQCLTKFINPKTTNYQNPYPVMQGINIKYDPMFELVQQKQDYQLKIETIKNMYRKYQKKMRIDKQFECYQNMQNLLAKDPDKYFCSNYNWYYTNGNLIIQNLENIPFIFYINHLTDLCVSELNRTNTDWYIKTKSILCNHNSDIYQLDCVNVLSKSFLGVREKKAMLIYDVQVSDNKQVTCRLVCSQSADIPLVAMSLNKGNAGEYATIDAKQTLALYDLSEDKKMYEYVVAHDLDDLEGDCFAQLSYTDNNMFMYANRTTLLILDKRSNSICTKYHIKNNDVLELYDRFVNIYPCQTNSFYISTFRDLLLFDLRCNKVSSKYSHYFSSAPLITDVMNNSDKSIVCLSSSKPNEKMILEKESNSNFIPVCLPTITNSYESSLLHSTNMSFSLSMKQRLDASTTGMRLWCDENNRFVVFSINILGDIYCYALSKPKKLYNRHLCNWNKLLSDSYEYNQLNFVDKVVLNDVEFEYNSKPISLTSVIKKKRIVECIQNLQKSKKGYNMKICDVWDNVTKTSTNVLDDMEEIPTNVTVQNWLSEYCP